MKSFGLFLLACTLLTQSVHAQRWLKQSTAFTEKIGPFVNSTDAVTPETALTISQADVLLSKASGVFAQKNDATAATHDAQGWYLVTFNTTDTATLGALIVSIQETGALPVWVHYVVVPANTYDALMSGTDALNADVDEWNGTAIAGVDTAGYPKVTIKDGTGTGEIDTASGVAKANTVSMVNVALSGAETAGNFSTFFGNAAAVSTQVIDNIGSIKTRTDRIPNVAAGASGGLFIAGTNADTTVNITGTISIASGGITTSSFAAGAINAAAIAPDALGASELAEDAIDELSAIVATDAATKLLTGATIDGETVSWLLAKSTAALLGKTSGNTGLAGTQTEVVRNVADDATAFTIITSPQRNRTTFTDGAAPDVNVP